MKYTILMGSPRRNGNTAALLRPFLDENQRMDVEQDVIWLYEQDVKPCLGCKACQDSEDSLGCVQKDGLQVIFDCIQRSDVLVLATPIYSWYCTAPMKTLMDRLIYAGCKYYGQEKQRSVYWKKGVASFTTCGYQIEKGADLWEEGLRRWCKHGGMEYLGMFCRRDTGKEGEFMDKGAELDVRDFAHMLYAAAESSL